KVLLVIDRKDKLLGTINNGDIRRYMLTGKTLKRNIRGIYNRNPVYIQKEEYSADLAYKMIIKNKIELLPVLDANHKVIDFTTWDEALSSGRREAPRAGRVDIPVVIMSGGRGKRLEPFSKILPKPLIPIGEKPIVEIIIDEFKKHGISEYYLTLDYKGKMIQSYFDNIEKDYKLHYLWDEKQSGTAGSLRLLEKEKSAVFIVSNCDVIVNANFEEVIKFHKEHKSDLTIISAMQHHKIPYGVVKFKENGKVVNIIEKPEYTFIVNTGVYVLNRKSLGIIPEGKCFDMPELIENLIKNGKNVCTYPVTENDYVDIGQWDVYKKVLEKMHVSG
ncbi:sugar phosphate nucleotidyltransferase, partial [Candidatus Omnitrophota bacterium]